LTLNERHGDFVVYQSGSGFCSVIGVGKDTVLPSLRTVRAVFPHTALQSVVHLIGIGSLVGPVSW